MQKPENIKQATLNLPNISKANVSHAMIRTLYICVALGMNIPMFDIHQPHIIKLMTSKDSNCTHFQYTTNHTWPNPKEDYPHFISLHQNVKFHYRYVGIGEAIRAYTKILGEVSRQRSNIPHFQLNINIHPSI